MSTKDMTAPEDGGGTLPKRALLKPMLILCIAVAVLMGAIFGWQRFVGHMIGKAMAGMAAAPQTVSTTIAANSDWQPRIAAQGTVRAVRGADLAAQASGVVDQLHIESGADVAAGAVLLTLLPNDDPAKLAQLEAQAELDEITLKRDQQQLAAQAISQATVDTDTANLKAARAQVEAQRALMAEKTVRAPFSGTLGLRQVDQGQYLSAGTTVVTLQALDPVYIDFYLPQQALSQVRAGQAVSATLDAYPGVRFAGKITSINSKVDATSRNAQARASFANPDRRLIPGMYATVEVAIGESKAYVTLPQTAITFNPYGDTVFLVERGGADKTHPTLTVRQRFVQVGDTRGDQIAITNGVAAGDEVVTAGQLKLRNGIPVNIDNKIQPDSNPNPTPPNE